MAEEQKEDLINALHSKGRLPSLRTYQGDMAEFIKDKNESVISIAVKEQERKEKREDEEGRFAPKEDRGGGFQISATIIILSLVLLAGGGITFLYVYEFLTNKPTVPAVDDIKQIIPFNNTLTLANISPQNLTDELLKLNPSPGVSVIDLSDSNGNKFAKISDLFNFLKISPPNTLSRTLRGEYALGVLLQKDIKSNFLVMRVNDFGQAFSGMLEWESLLSNDLAFLGLTEGGNENEWRDLIIKNKDTRALGSEGGTVQIAYTFLDKDTVLVTNNLSAIGEMASVYASRSVIR